MKKILIGAGVVVVLVAGGLFYLAGNLDNLIKQAVEDIGTEATGAKVSLSEVEMLFSEGTGTLSGLRVGNPAGFKTDYAFDLGGISVTIDTDTITSDPVVIKEIVIDRPKLIYELDGTSSNVDAIQKNVDAFSGGSSGGSSGGEGPKLVIEDLYIRGGEVSVSAGFLAGKALGTALPDIHLEDIGKDEGGASAGEVASEVISSLTDGISGAVAGLDLEGMMKDVTGAAAEAAGQASEAAQGAMEGAAEGAAGAVEGVTESIGSGISNMLGN